ncbi:MAG: TlpA family protein disulfide reductase [Bacteroidales bacterium]|nr:TlpA family protein disulfide reductase [Bacteroidales bacterium]
MVLKLKFFTVLFFICTINLVAQDVHIHGNAIDYAGEELVFLTFADQITYSEKELCKTIIDENGNFSCSFSTNETIYVFLHLGKYEAFLFTETNKDYEIILPERLKKSIGDELNPYFEPIQYHLGIENSSEKELNYQLAFFDEVFSILLKNTSYAIYTKDKTLDIDLEISKVDSVFSNVDNKYFNDFKKYKYASYRHLAYQEKSKSISNTYYLNNEILYSNPSYMGLFNQVYKEYFQYFGRTEAGKKIFEDIGKHKSISLLKETLGQDSILTNDTLKELVILKCLHDEFYNDLLSRSAMVTVLDSLASETEILRHKQIASNIREKVTKLMVGYKPPEFQLFDKDSNLVSLESFKGKYVYLSFCTTVSYACIKEFEMLRTLYDNHKDHFEIVVICLDETLAQMKHFVELKEYPFTFLHYGNQSEVFKDYDIRAFPTYYFINKKGELELSPAPSPDQKAEFIIYNVMKANGDI